MATTPTGPISLPLGNARSLLAACPTWVTWAGSGNSATALAHVHLVDLPAPADGKKYTLAEMTGYRPFAIIDLADGGLAFSADRSAEVAFERSGRLSLTIESAVATGDVGNDSEIVLKALNNIGGIVSDIIGNLDDDQGLVADGGHLNVRKVELVSLELCAEEDGQTQGVFVRAALNMEYGT